MSENIKLTTSDKFTERGIRFQVAKVSHEEEIWRLLCDSFFPQCPISR